MSNSGKEFTPINKLQDLAKFVTQFIEYEFGEGESGPAVRRGHLLPGVQQLPNGKAGFMLKLASFNGGSGNHGLYPEMTELKVRKLTPEEIGTLDFKGHAVR